MKASIFTTLLLLPVAAALAAPQEFDFKDPKGVNNVVFKLDAPLESINGTATGISGKVTFDPEKPAALKGRIVVEAASLHVGNPMMKEHMHGENWLNVARHPQITFEVVGVRQSRTDGNVTTAEVDGRMTIKGVTKAMVVPVKLTHLKDKLRARGSKVDGDLLVVRASFPVKRSDFDIQAGKNEDKVSDQIELSLSVAGAAPRP